MPLLSAHATIDAAARAAERAFYGLAMDDGAGAGALPVAEHVRTPDGRLYGGAMLGVAITAMETATERRIVWATTQFLASAPHGARIEVAVEELARGKRSSQVLVRGATADGPMFTALGATGSEGSDDFEPEYFAMPDAPSPDDCAPLRARGGLGGQGYETVTDIRAAGETSATRPPQLLLWARTLGHCTTLPAMLALVGDHLPYSLGRMAGFEGAGASLDNSLRVGPRTEHEWVLLECRPEMGAYGYGHGTVYLWSPDGVLLAVGSQSSGMRTFDQWRGRATPGS